MYHSVKSEHKKSLSNLWQITKNQFSSHLNYLIDNPNLTGQILYCDNGAHLNSSEK